MGTEEDRFRDLYGKNYYLLQKIAVNRGIPEDEAEDAVQETFTNYYEHYPLTWSDLHVRMVLVKIMRNFCIDYFRRKARYPVDVYSTDDLESVLAFGLRKTERDTLDIVMENIMFDDLLEGLREMKSDMLTVFIMRIVQGRSMDEISRTVGISEAACRMRLTRARRFLETYIQRKNALSIYERGRKTILGEPGFDVSSEDP